MHARMHIGGGKTLQALLACNMALLEVGKIAFSGTPGIIDYMRTHHLLAVQQNCGRCAVVSSHAFRCHAHRFAHGKSEVPSMPLIRGFDTRD